MSKPFLSKSRYLIGLQCPRLLWIHYHDKDRLPPVNEQTQVAFDQGHDVGLLAQRLFTGGIAVEGDSIEEVINNTNTLLTKRKPLFEPGFSFHGGYTRLDILNPIRNGKWEIVEVKSSTSVKDPNWDDVAFQKFCCQGVGLSIQRCNVMHIDSTYVRHGEIDPEGLFTKEDVTKQVDEKVVGLEDRAKEMLRVVHSRRCPQTSIGPHCDAMYGCPLRGECWKDVDAVEDNVFTLYRLGSKAWQLHETGVVSDREIPEDFRLSKAQHIQVEADRTGKPHVNPAAAKTFLEQLEYPLYFLDFETFQTAIPLVEGTRPYQQIPFQFSLHVVQSADSDPVHYSWLWNGKGDPRKELLDRLSRLMVVEGTIVVFNATFEKSRLRESAEAHPEHGKWVENALERIADLLDPFRSFDIYYPSQHGTASLKAVLPALTGKNYNKLGIQDGAQAAEQFKRVTFGDASEDELKQARLNLESYCWTDTWGMVEIVGVLRGFVGKSERS